MTKLCRVEVVSLTVSHSLWLSVSVTESLSLTLTVTLVFPVSVTGFPHFSQYLNWLHRHPKRAGKNCITHSLESDKDRGAMSESQSFIARSRSLGQEGRDRVASPSRDWVSASLRFVSEKNHRLHPRLSHKIPHQILLLLMPYSKLHFLACYLDNKC